MKLTFNPAGASLGECFGIDLDRRRALTMIVFGTMLSTPSTGHSISEAALSCSSPEELVYIAYMIRDHVSLIKGLSADMRGKMSRAIINGATYEDVERIFRITDLKERDKEIWILAARLCKCIPCQITRQLEEKVDRRNAARLESGSLLAPGKDFSQN